MGFPVAGKMDFVPVLLQVMPQMEGPRGMPEPFPADDKKEFHGNPAGMVCSVSLYSGTRPPSGCRQGLLHGFLRGFRNDDPGNKVNDDADARRVTGNDHPDQTDDTRVDIDMLT
jgi:hypothetical protein